MRLFILAFVFISSLMAEEMTPDQALKKLIRGNLRFAADCSICPDRTSERRKETAENQTPFATIVGCADSRVSPEILFDQGLGDLFIVRVAGNVVGPLELDSVEYSTYYLHSSFVLVLGHENCGAVKAVMQGQTADIEAVAQLIEPALQKAASTPGDKLENTIKANVQMVVQQLRTSPVLAKLIQKGALNIRGGYYNFHTGKVEILQ